MLGLFMQDLQRGLLPAMDYTDTQEGESSDN